MRKLILLFIMSLISFSYVSAQHLSSGSKVLNVQEAKLPEGGTLTFYNNMAAYGGQDAAGGSVWDVRNAFNIDYSFNEYFMVSLNPTIYQDLNDGSGGANTPIHDLVIAFKTGSFGFASDYMYLGGVFDISLALGDEFAHNTPFEPYRGLGPGVGVTALLSYYADNLFPDESFSSHLNLGFKLYFDKDKKAFKPERSNLLTTKSGNVFKYGLAGKYPTTFIDLYGELWGGLMLTELDTYIFGRESYSYLTLGVGAKPLDFLKLDISGDILVSGSEDESKNPAGPVIADVNYAPWKINVGLKANILPFKTTYTLDPTRRYEISEREATEIRQRVRIIEEDEAVTREKVEVLKTRRKDVEKNLQQLRDLLKDLDNE